MDKISTGSSGEKQASEFLQKQGFKILAKNFRTRFGEIDIVALEGDTLVFIEVKSRNSRIFGLPEEAVGFRKLQHLLKAASYYRSNHKNLPESERIDVVAIEPASNRIELIRNVTG